MKTIGLLNTPECPCLWTHRPVCLEFLEGFTSFGYETCEITTTDDISSIDIMLLSNHIIDISYLNELNKLSPNTIYILWYYEQHLHKIPFKKFILTSEYFYKPPILDYHKAANQIFTSIKNYVPLLLRANEDPEKIGKYKKTYELDGCFMGTPYKPDWVHGLNNILYHSINSSGMLDYNTRRANHLKSKIGFGFHNDSNIVNNHVTQRVFESLTYGCVVISDNPSAEEMTDGIVVYARTKDDFLEKYNYYLAHPEECKRKEEQGYKWCKQYGTNRYAASLFLDKIKELGF
jgi:hypothetical protein